MSSCISFIGNIAVYYCVYFLTFRVAGIFTSGNIDPSEVDDLFKLVDENKDGKIQYEGTGFVLSSLVEYILP